MEERRDQGRFEASSFNHNFPTKLDVYVRLCKARLRDKTQIIFVRMNSRFTYTFKIGRSLWYFMLTSFNINCPWDNHVSGGEFRGNRFLFRKVRVLKNSFHGDRQWHRIANYLVMYCRQIITINDCDIARPAFLPATL